MVFLKNSPEINYKLWLVKHLIRIKPLALPDGLPDEHNHRGFILKANGQFVQSKLARENYKRQRNRPELERYILLREEQEFMMREKWFNGSLDGTLLPTLAEDQHPTIQAHRESYSQVGKGAFSKARKNELGGWELKTQNGEKCL